MTDNEIIRIAENCCSDKPNCTCCPFDVGTNTVDECMEKLIQHCVDLINRQKAEIERLQKYNTDVAFKHYNDGKSEAIKGFAEKINEIFMRYAHLHTYAEQSRLDDIEALDGTKIEMQSVWDVLSLKKHEIAEYEEMNRLQENIETVAKERLLTELEKDFRLLIKEMCGE